MSRRAVLVALEGPKHCGKSSVTRLLADRLPTWFLTREPTSRFDLRLESHLCGSDLAAAIHADRSAHVKSDILPALANGQSVLTDRYLMSGLAFQTLDGVPETTMWEQFRQFPLPDISIVLIADQATIEARAKSRGLASRIERTITPQLELQAYLSAAASMQAAGSRVELVLNTNASILNEVVDQVESIATGAEVR